MSKPTPSPVIPNDEQCALAMRLYEAQNIYVSDAAQILAERDWKVYGPLLEERDDLREYLNTEISTNSEIGDELLAERAASAEFKERVWEETQRLCAELASHKVQNNHNWQFQEISEDALKRAGAAETKVELQAAIITDLELRLGGAVKALQAIHETAHCAAKAGPLSIPDMQSAYAKLLHISAMATNGVWTAKGKTK